MQHDYHSHPLPSAPPKTDYDLYTPPPSVTSATYHTQTSSDAVAAAALPPLDRQQQQRKWALPPGWKTAHRESDGRIYYWEMSTGRTSWSHPTVPDVQPPRPLIDLPFFRSQNHRERTLNQQLQASGPNGNGRRETPGMASRHPDSHQCLSLFAALVFPPLGVCALVHSCLVGKRWGEGRYGESYEHSRQAYRYAWWSVVLVVGMLVWFWWWEGRWPDFGWLWGWFD